MKTRVIKVDSLFPDQNDMMEAARVIRQGGLVVFPTETVYGIAADFNNPEAVAKLREVKRRSDEKPFSAMIYQRGLIDNYSSLTDPKLYKLIDRYWPGPLTVIVPNKTGDGTVGVRYPDHMVALKLVELSQTAIAAPSANFEGNPAPTTCEEALRDLDGLVDLALDSGPVDIGKASTIVDFTVENPKVIREGVITQADVDFVVNTKDIVFVCTGNSCRSVMAEYVLKAELGKRMDVKVHSAGTSVFFQSPASAETISVLSEQGIDASAHISQPIRTILLKKADLVFVMTRSHRSVVLERVPSVEKRVYLLKEFVHMPKGLEMQVDVPDPMGHSHQAYKETLHTIKEAVQKIVELI